MAYVAIKAGPKQQRRGIDWLVDKDRRRVEKLPVKGVYPGNGASKVPCIDPQDQMIRVA